MRKMLFVWVAMIMATGLSFAQTYHFSVSSEPYQDLTGGTSLVSQPWDDPIYSVSIPFSFDFYNQTLSDLFQIQDFNSISLFTSDFNDTLSFMTPYGADLVDRGIGTPNSLSPITYKLEGSLGSRVLIIEWQNAGFYGQYFDSGTTPDFVNFQVRLYEDSGDIEFHYGPSSISQANLDFNGASGPFVGLLEAIKLPEDAAVGEVVLLSGNASNPTVQDDYGNYFLNGTPPPNTVYKFSREMVATHDPIVVAKQVYYGPNPATDVLALQPEWEQDVFGPVMIYNANGAFVMKDDEPSSIDISNLTPGIYHLQFATANGKVTQRIVVVR